MANRHRLLVLVLAFLLTAFVLPQQARDMAKALRSLGFDVIERVNADEKTMVEAFDTFYSKLKQ